VSTVVFRRMMRIWGWIELISHRGPSLQVA
jgi:hypothetical protein